MNGICNLFNGRARADCINIQWRVRWCVITLLLEQISVSEYEAVVQRSNSPKYWGVLETQILHKHLVHVFFPFPPHWTQKLSQAQWSMRCNLCLICGANTGSLRAIITLCNCTWAAVYIWGKQQVTEIQFCHVDLMGDDAALNDTYAHAVYNFEMVRYGIFGNLDHIPTLLACWCRICRLAWSVSDGVNECR